MGGGVHFERQSEEEGGMLLIESLRQVTNMPGNFSTVYLAGVSRSCLEDILGLLLPLQLHEGGLDTLITH